MLRRQKRNKGWKENEDLGKGERVILKKEDIDQALRILDSVFPQYKNTFIVSLDVEEMLINGDRDD